MNSCVYFVQVHSDGPIKIGWTRESMASRVVNFRTHCPYPIEVLGVIPGAGETQEAELHAKFKNDRIRGEWFAPTPDLMDYIRSNAVPWTKPYKDCRRGVNHHNTSLNDEKVLEIRRRIGNGEPLLALAADFNVTTMTIRSIAQRRTWKHVQ